MLINLGEKFEAKVIVGQVEIGWDSVGKLI